MLLTGNSKVKYIGFQLQVIRITYIGNDDICKLCI